jgi:hypothetical protein
MSLEKSPQEVFYIGKKAVKQDTVAGTGLIWSGYGDSHMVPHSSAVLLMQHVDVWCGLKRFQELNPESSANTTDTDPHAEVPIKGLSDLARTSIAPVEPQETPDLGENIERESAQPESHAPVDAIDSSANTTDTDSRLVFVMSAILSLDKSNPEHFSQQTGNPIIAAVRDAASDQEITVKEVNLAWKKLNLTKVS